MSMVRVSLFFLSMMTARDVWEEEARSHIVIPHLDVSWHRMRYVGCASY